ncbi:MAG TPA: methyltransferase domain-containing protein, partial [Thermoleophilaceae bacterium]|nr:methyltransferase domain-containing protein [Thermoleophilaceae bacterium]
ESFDVILTCSTFEHVKYPWIAAHELMKTLRVGGQLYLQTVHSFPLHGYPSDYYRFSREALASLFPAGMGFKVVATNYDFPIRMHSRRVPGLELHPAYLNSTLWGEKVAPTPPEFRPEL